VTCPAPAPSDERPSGEPSLGVSGLAFGRARPRQATLEPSRPADEQDYCSHSRPVSRGPTRSSASPAIRGSQTELTPLNWRSVVFSWLCRFVADGRAVCPSRPLSPTARPRLSSCVLFASRLALLMAGKKKKKKLRVAFRKNRQKKSRARHAIRELLEEQLYEEEPETDLPSFERVSGKGDLTRHRTVIGVEAEDGDQTTLLLDVDESQCLRGRVLRAVGLTSLVQAEDGRQFECTVRRLLRTLQTDERNPVACRLTVSSAMRIVHRNTSNVVRIPLL